MRAALRFTLAAALYGFTLGLPHDWLYASRNLVKLPLLMASTGLVCALAYPIVAGFCGLRLGWMGVQRLALGLFHDLAWLLASLASVNLLFALAAHRAGDASLGDYDLFLGLNIGFVALSGTGALLRQARRVLKESACTPARARWVVVGWLAVSLLVGGQMAFLLRPMFGLPTTRGGRPPWFLGAQADLRGATNFYEMVWQAMRAPELPLRSDE